MILTRGSTLTVLDHVSSPIAMRTDETQAYAEVHKYVATEFQRYVDGLFHLEYNTLASTYKKISISTNHETFDTLLDLVRLAVSLIVYRYRIRK